MVKMNFYLNLHFCLSREILSITAFILKKMKNADALVDYLSQGPRILSSFKVSKEFIVGYLHYNKIQPEANAGLRGQLKDNEFERMRYAMLKGHFSADALEYLRRQYILLSMGGCKPILLMITQQDNWGSGADAEYTQQPVNRKASNFNEFIVGLKHLFFLMLNKNRLERIIQQKGAYKDMLSSIEVCPLSNDGNLADG